jgi:hypothetical protein
MNGEVQKHIEEIIDELECPKQHLCYTSGLKDLCRARDIGLDSFVACLKEDPMECKFSILYGGVSFCQCKLRVYIAKRLGR